MNLYLIRHQKTPWNVEGILQGRNNSQDIIHDEDFRNAVKKNKTKLSLINFDCILSSPQKRAQQTAIEYGHPNFMIESKIIEFDFGKWEGVSRSKMLNENKEQWENSFMTFKGGETYDQFSGRLDEFLINYKQFDNILAFTHGAVCRYFISKANGLNINKMNQIQVGNNQIVYLKGVS